MTNSGNGLHELVTQLSLRIIEEHMRNVASYDETRQLVAQGVLDQASVDQAYLAFVREEGEKYLRKVTDLSVRYYAELIGLGTGWAKEFYERLLREATEEPASAAAASPAAGKRKANSADG